MSANFWTNLRAKHPLGIVGLSPMDGVTDLPMRLMTAKYGAPDILWTEFVNVEGMLKNPARLERALWTDPPTRVKNNQLVFARLESKRQDFSLVARRKSGPTPCKSSSSNPKNTFRLANSSQQKTVDCSFCRLEINGGGAKTRTIAQLYGLRPDNFAALTTRLINHQIPRTSGIVGIDLNMGCPARQVALNGAGAGLIQNKPLAKEIYLATLEAAQGKLPVSIKTRLGFNELEIEDWLGWLAEELKPAAIILHGRTYRQGYSGHADWEAIARAARLIKSLSPNTIVLGNGDVQSRGEAQEKVVQYGVDGVLIGRAAMGNPFVFADRQEASSVINFMKTTAVPELASSECSSPEAKSSQNENNDRRSFYLALALEHALLYEQCFSSLSNYSFLPMRKHLAWYARGFAGASALRAQLMQANSSADLQLILEVDKKKSNPLEAVLAAD
ncbi:tRNA-dihydrouridine synthase [Microgenomates group bacterium]|nr:tRNA-dihydrouridine synthase [Microgenomates group bacterium]